MKYNATKYIKKLNRALEQIWIVFHPSIRMKIPSPNKLYKRDANDRAWFTDEEIQLVHGYALEGKEDKQQDMDDLMVITEDEYEFWEMVNLSPNSPFDYQEVIVNKSYVVDMSSYEIRETLLTDLKPSEVIMDGRELMRFLGDKVIIDVENPPYKFVNV
jgi:hypothetical protein